MANKPRKAIKICRHQILEDPPKVLYKPGRILILNNELIQEWKHENLGTVYVKTPQAIIVGD